MTHPPRSAALAAGLAAALAAPGWAQDYNSVVKDAGRLIQQGKAAEAVPNLRSFAATAPVEDAARSANAIGFALYSSGDLDGAVRTLEAAIRLARAQSDDETLVKATNNLGVALFTRGDYPRAREVFNDAAGLGSDLAAEYLALLDTQINAQAVGDLTEKGVSAFFAKDLDAAMGFYDQALALDPDNSRVLNLRGYLHLRLKEIAAARTDLERAVALDPEGVIPRINLLKVTCAEDAAAPLPPDLAPRTTDERETYNSDGELRRLCGDRLAALP